MSERFTFFWRTASPFSQWHPCKFEIDGVIYNCAEQFMMWKKAELFGDTATMFQIGAAKEPRIQKELGRKVSNFQPKIWNAVARDIVFRGNVAKFTQNNKLLKELLRTMGTTLVEASPNDTVWGIGLAEDNPLALNRETWNGTNWLGQVLTEVRESIIAVRKDMVSELKFELL